MSEPAPGAGRPFQPLRRLLEGLLIGSADAVPGVSGGTIALLLGVYARLLDSLSAVLRSPSLARSPAGRREVASALSFLVPLGVGLLAAYWLVTRLLVGPTADPGLLRRASTAPYFYAGFAGLVVATAWTVWRGVTAPGRLHAALLVAGIVVAAGLTGLPQVSGDPPTWALFPGGAAAVSVMLLPGVSGSLLLVILGQYSRVAAAVHDRDLVTLGVFLAGVAAGVALTVPLLRRLLAARPRATLAFLTGLMIGSLRSLWPWKHEYDAEAGPLLNRFDLGAPGGPSLLGLAAAAALGVAAVVGMRALEARWRGKDDPDEGSGRSRLVERGDPG